MKSIFSILTLLLILDACKTQPNLEKEKQAILILHENQKKAHFEKNVSLLLADSSSDFVEVNRGLVKKLNRDESVRRFQAYFNAVDFVKWDDEKPPIFRFSDDATMATTVVEKLVITKQKFEANRLDTAHYAWLAVYKKNNEKWQMVQIVSTNK